MLCTSIQKVLGDTLQHFVPELVHTVGYRDVNFRPLLTVHLFIYLWFTVHICNFARGSEWVRNLVSDIKGNRKKQREKKKQEMNHTKTCEERFTIVVLQLTQFFLANLALGISRGRLKFRLPTFTFTHARSLASSPHSAHFGTHTHTHSSLQASTGYRFACLVSLSLIVQSLFDIELWHEVRRKCTYILKSACRINTHFNSTRYCSGYLRCMHHVLYCCIVLLYSREHKRSSIIRHFFHKYITRY
jgi:hypothetical protein